MRTRAATPADYDDIRKLHERMGLNFKFPDLADDRLIVKNVIEDDHGRIVAAHVLRVEAEVMLWLDTNRSDRVRWKAIRELGRACELSAWAQGISSIFAWVPESVITKGFLHILTRLGYFPVRSGWRAFVKEI